MLSIIDPIRIYDDRGKDKTKFLIDQFYFVGEVFYDCYAIATFEGIAEPILINLNTREVLNKDYDSFLAENYEK
jgi:hypothetical protein